MKSMKTTLAGIGAILVATGNAITEYVNTGTIDISTLITGITVGSGLLAARDHGVTSEQAGAK